LAGLTLAVGSCATLPGQPPAEDLLLTGLIGWQQIGGEDGAWRFRDGILYTEGAGGNWLSTGRQYDDFDLTLEFRLSEGANSGLFLRAPHEGDPAYTGMEIQILDDYADRLGSLRGDQYTASIYDVQAVSERASRPAGQWQKMRIVCRGPRVKVILNGRKVIDVDVTDFSHKSDTHPGLERRRGYIGLQDHGSFVEFRRIKIREFRD
jgi:hypothetical protein